jgi:hypothetical protein
MTIPSANSAKKTGCPHAKKEERKEGRRVLTLYHIKKLTKNGSKT